MKKNILTFAMLSALILSSCNQNPTQESQTNEVETRTEKIETITSVDENGKELQLAFDNSKETVSITFEGETFELHSEKPASGIWYKNDQYELRGKGENLELKKDGEIIFKN